MNFMKLLGNRNGTFLSSNSFPKFTHKEFIDLANIWITEARRCMTVNV